MEIICGPQGDQAWFQNRLSSLGASSMPKVLAKGKGRSDLLERYALESITGERTEDYSNKNMHDGIIAEPAIRSKYELMTGYDVECVSLIKADLKNLHVSPDGLVNKDGEIEIKKRIRKVQFSYAVARKDGWADEWKTTGKQDKLTQGIPSNPEYIQVQTLLWVSKRKWCDYVSCAAIVDENDNVTFDYAMGDDWIIIQRVYRDESFIKTIKDETIKFLAELKMLIRKME